MNKHEFKGVLSIQSDMDKCLELNLNGINLYKKDSGVNWSMNSDGASIKFYNNGDGDTNSRLEFNIRDDNNEFFRWTSYTGNSYSELMKLVPNDTTNGLTFRGNKIFHAGNDGSGSGLDADTVGTLQASQFLRSDTSDTMTGNLTVGGNVITNNLNIGSATTTSYIVEESITLATNKSVTTPEFSPTGAPPVTPIGVYFCQFSSQWFAYTLFGSMSRSLDGLNWTTCKLTGIAATHALITLSSVRLPNGTVRLYTKLNAGYGGGNLVSDDYGDSWVSGSLNGSNNYYGGHSSSSHHQTTISYDANATGTNAFGLQPYGYGLSHRSSEYFYDAATDGAMRRNWVRWALSRWRMTDSTRDGNNFLTNGTVFFGGTSTAGNAYNLLTDAEIDQIFAPVGSWWEDGGTGNIAWTHSAYNWYPNGGMLYNHVSDLYAMGGGTYYGSSWLTLFIGGLRHMHLHKAAGGTINSAFINSCPVKCFVCHFNYYIKNYRWYGSAGNNGMGGFNITTPNGALIQSHGSRSWFAPIELYTTNSGIQDLADGVGYQQPETRWIYHIPGLSYTGQVTKESPYDPNNDVLLFTTSDGTVKRVTGADLAEWSRNGTQPTVTTYHSTATVGGVADTFVGSESSNSSSDVKDNISLYALDIKNRSRIVGVGQNGTATRKNIQSSYDANDVWQNTFANGLSIPIASAVFNHAERNRTCIEFPTVYSAGSIVDIDVNSDGEWSKDGVWNIAGGYSMQWNFQTDWLYAQDNNRTPHILGTQGTRAADWFPTTTGWNRRNSESTDTTYTDFIDTGDTSKVNSVGRLFPGSWAEYNPLTSRQQKSNGDYIIHERNRENRSGAATQTNYIGGSYMDYFVIWDRTGSTHSDAGVTRSYAFRTNNAMIGWLWGKGWDTYDYNNMSRGTNVNYNSDNQWGFNMFARMVFQYTATYQRTRTTMEDDYASDNYCTRIPGRWYPESGDVQYAYVYDNNTGISQSNFQDTDLWRFELHLCSKAPNGGSPTSGMSTQKLTDITDTTYTQRNNGNSQQGTPMSRLGLSKSATFGGLGLEAWLKSKVPASTVDDWAVVDAAGVNDPANSFITITDITVGELLWTGTNLFDISWRGQITGNENTALMIQAYNGDGNWSVMTNLQTWTANTIHEDGPVPGGNLLLGRRIRLYWYGTDIYSDEIVFGESVGSPTTRKEWIFEVRAVYTPDTSKYFRKWLQVRTGSTGWPDEPWLSQVQLDLSRPHGFGGNGYEWRGNLANGSFFNFFYADSGGGKYSHHPVDLFDNWDSQSESSTLTFAQALRANSQSAETHATMVAAGRAQSGRYIYSKFFCHLATPEGSLYLSFRSPSTDSSTRNNSVDYDYLQFVYVDSNNKLCFRNFPPPVADTADSWSYIFTTQNNTLYAIGRGGSVKYRLFYASMVNVDRNQNTMSVPWNEISLEQTGITSPVGITYSLPLQKYILVGESGLYVTSVAGTTTWVSELKPQYGFSQDSRTGLYKDPDNSLHFLIDASKRMSIDGTKVSLLPQATYTAKVVMPNLPTTKPSQTGMLWNNGGTLSVS